MSVRALSLALTLIAALAAIFLLPLPSPVTAQEQRPVDLELSMINRHPAAELGGRFVVSVLNDSDVTVRGIRVKLEVEDIEQGRRIYLEEACGDPLPDCDGIVDYDTQGEREAESANGQNAVLLEWIIPNLKAGGRATTIHKIDRGRTDELSATEFSVVRLQGSILESTPREDPAFLGNNQARHYVSATRDSPRMTILVDHSVYYGVDADAATNTFTVKVVNPNRSVGVWLAQSPIQYQLRFRVTPSPGLRYTAAPPAGTTFDAATGIWDIGTLALSPTGDKQLDIRVTERDAWAGPAEEQCLTVEIAHKVPDPPAFWVPVTACMAHKALITGGGFDIFNWHDCVADSDYPCGNQPSLELTAVKSTFERGDAGVGPYAVDEVHRARLRSDYLAANGNNMILQPEEAVLQLPDWSVNRKTESGNTVWSTVDLFDLNIYQDTNSFDGTWSSLKESVTVSGVDGAGLPGRWRMGLTDDSFDFLDVTDSTKVEGDPYGSDIIPADGFTDFKIEFGALGTYVALFEIEGTKSGTTYTDSGTYTFHVGPVAELAVRGLRADEPAAGVEPGQTALTVVAVNNGPDHALGAKVDVTLPAGVTVASHAASDGTYDEATGTWDLGALQHRDYRTANGQRPEATLTLILEGENCPHWGMRGGQSGHLQRQR